MPVGAALCAPAGSFGPMRAVILPLLLAAALLAAPVALAEGSDDRRRDGESKEKAFAARAEQAGNDDNKSARAEERAAFRDNRTALFDRVIAQLHALRESWHENATKVREGCKSADIDHRNASKEDRTAHAHCIRDGYKAWRAAHSAEIKGLREELKLLLDARRDRHDG